jgi:hypothetical protein
MAQLVEVIGEVAPDFRQLLLVPNGAFQSMLAYFQGFSYLFLR